MTEAERIALLEKIAEEALKFSRKVRSACRVNSKALDDALRVWAKSKEQNDGC